MIKASSAPAWFCVIAQRKHEYIAAAQLAERHGVRVFAPRIRFRRPGRQGTVWATEALFPSYFFAKIAPASLRCVHYAPQVRGIVHFGESWPTVPDETIEELEKTVHCSDIHVIAPELIAGDEVKVINGAFNGLEAVVTRVMPARERVMILLDFLGRQTVVELTSEALLKNAEQREWLFHAA